MKQTIQIKNNIEKNNLYIKERKSIYKKWHNGMTLVAKERSKSKGSRNQILYERIWEIVRLYQPVSEEIRLAGWKNYELHQELNGLECE